jgi:ESF2/ABP1 family protein
LSEFDRFAGDESRTRRVRSGGNKKQLYTEGWVEFLRRSDAKRCAELYHNRPVVANQRGFHGSDLWALKFLRKFQWHHLQEKLQYEQRLRAARLRSGLAEARRENEAYLRRVGAAERFATVERAKRRRAADGEGGEAEAAASPDAGAGSATADPKRARSKKGGSAGRAERIAAADAEITAQRVKVTRQVKQAQPITMRLGKTSK